MKDTFTKSMSWLHTWASLLLGWLLFFIFLTGTLGYFQKEITQWMKPELPISVNKFTQQELVQIAMNHLKKEAPSSKKWLIKLPNSRENILSVTWSHVRKDKATAMGGHGGGRGKRTTHIINPHTKEIVKPRRTGGGGLLYRMHYRLHYVNARTVGRYIVGIASMLMLIGLITGIIIHLRKILKDFFTFRQDRNLHSWLDGHIFTSVLALPFHLMITYSGLAFFVFTYMPLTALANYDGDMRNYIQEAFPREKAIKIQGIKEPLASIEQMRKNAEAYFGSPIKSISIINQGDSSAIVNFTRENSTLFSSEKADKVYFSGIDGKMIENQSPNRPKATRARDILTGLHRGDFANIYARWLYFLSGVLGTFMIATGLVIWTKKREAKQKDTLGFKLVDNLNMVTIAGLPIAVAVYFWANRLIPIDVPKRAMQEADAMFIAWLAVSVFVFSVNSRKMWVVLFYLSATLYALLPISNFFLTGRHLAITIAQGDWTLVWMDLMLFFTGLAFWYTGHKVQKKISS